MKVDFSLILLLSERSTEHCDRCHGKAVGRVWAAADLRLGGRAVGVRVTTLSFRMPLVCGRSGRDAVHRAGKMPVVSTCPIVETHLHCMFVVLVAVDQHYRPLSIWTLDGISCHQKVPSSVGYVTHNLEQLVGSIHWLHPLLGDQLRSHVLRRIADQLVVFID